jgi:hypothetical protein
LPVDQHPLTRKHALLNSTLRRRALWCM